MSRSARSATRCSRRSRARPSLVDVRSPAEFSGELISPPGYEQEGAQRAGHIPGAASVPWAQAVKEDGTFKSAEELRELYGGKGVLNGAATSSPTAASASARRTRGSCCTSCSATTTSRTTTARGRSGATSSTCRSRRTPERASGRRVARAGLSRPAPPQATEAASRSAVRSSRWSRIRAVAPQMTCSPTR